MKTLKTVFVALLVLIITAVQAQKIKVTNGDLAFLKGQTEVLLEYDFSEMAVGKFEKEEDYLAKKVAEYNKDEAGKGDTWKEKWISDREGMFYPKFEQLLNKYTAKADCNFSREHSTAKYTIIVKTTFTEPGFYIGIAKKDAMINLEIKFVETANKDNVLALMTMTNIPGRGGSDIVTGPRIAEAYAKGGKELGAYLVKKAF